MKEPKNFDIGTVLSVSTGFMLTTMDDIHALIDHILGGGGTTTITLAAMANPCKQYLFHLFPELEEVDTEDFKSSISAVSDREKFCQDWVKIQARYYGEYLEIPVMPPGMLAKLEGNYDDRFDALFNDELEKYDEYNPLNGSGENPLRGAL